MSSGESKLKHLNWAIKHRQANQVCSLKLLALFYKYEKDWKTKKLARAAQDLTAVAFSLWRAAFLAEKTGRREEVFAHGKLFLERIIEDNTISFPQDKTSKEWTFNYYTRNARASLQILHEYWPEAVPEYIGQRRSATERWEYCQGLLDNAVAGFAKLLAKRKSSADQIQRAAAVRTARKTRRATVRKITLAGRNRSQHKGWKKLENMVDASKRESKAGESAKEDSLP